MRHGHGLRKLNRTSEHRLAMLRNMMNSLIEHEVIKTTVPKAKELRRVVEPMITLAKNPTLSNKRLAFDRLRSRDIVAKLFTELGPRYAARPGGYTRILKMGPRPGDSAPMALMQLVEGDALTAAPAGDDKPPKKARKVAAPKKEKAPAKKKAAPKADKAAATPKRRKKAAA